MGLYKAKEVWTGTLASSIPDGTTTSFTLTSSSGLTNGETYVFTIDRVDVNGTKTPNKKEVIIGTVSGSNVIDCIRGVEGTAQAHSAGAIVEILFTAKHWNNLIESFKAQHREDGSHKKIQGLDNNQAITQKDSAGTARNILKLNSSNDLEIGGAGISSYKLNNSIIKPSSDSTSAIKITKADGTTVILNIDSNNGFIGIGTTSPSTRLHVHNGRFRVSESDGSGQSGVIEISNGTQINYIFTASDGHLYIRTNNTSKHVLLQAGSSSGRVGIRTTSPQAALHSVGDGQTGNIIATNANVYRSDWPTGWEGGLGTWDISCAGIYYSTLIQRSDKRLKKNIKKLKIDNLIEKINYLKPVSFKWKLKDKGEYINYGFIAQEFIKIFPDLIRKDSNNYLSIDYIGIIPILVKAIQELSLKVENLEKKYGEINNSRT